MTSNRICTYVFNFGSSFCLMLCLHISAVSLVHAAANDWAEGSQAEADGATRDYYNRAGLLAWNNYLGDWRDANNTAQGTVAYATANLVDDDTPKFVEWNVKNLVQEWVSGVYQNQGMLLHGLSGGGTFNLRSREHSIASQRPELIVNISGQTLRFAPQADTYLEPSTYRSLGDSDMLRLAFNSNNTLLRFDLSSLAQNSTVSSATLRLYTHAQYGGSSMVVGVFRCTSGHAVSDSPPVLGLAAGYHRDQGIENNPDVIFFADFESDNWADQWSSVGGVLDPVSEDAARKFQPLENRALRSKIPQGSHTAMNMTYKFQREIGYEPEEIFFRYYLRLADDWNQTVQGGKMPGISGTYGIAGWGGRRSDGTNGWSARGHFYYTIQPDNPLAGTNPMGTYCYHADQATTYGDSWLWQNGYRGFLEKNRWYSVEQYLKMNTPGQKNGVIKAWVDGRLAFEKYDIRFRTVDTLKIEQIWMNVYHGGKTASPYDQHLFIDNVVIAKRYIGPLIYRDQLSPAAPINLRRR